MVRIIELSKEEQRQARDFRIEKCGYDDFEEFKGAFHRYVKKRSDATNGREKRG